MNVRQGVQGHKAKTGTASNRRGERTVRCEKNERGTVETNARRKKPGIRPEDADAGQGKSSVGEIAQGLARVRVIVGLIERVCLRKPDEHPNMIIGANDVPMRRLDLAVLVPGGQDRLVQVVFERHMVMPEGKCDLG